MASLEHSPFFLLPISEELLKIFIIYKLQVDHDYTGQVILIYKSA